MGVVEWCDEQGKAVTILWLVNTTGITTLIRGRSLSAPLFGTRTMYWPIRNQDWNYLFYNAKNNIILI